MEMGRCYPVCNKCSHQKQFIILFIGANICRLRLLESGTRMNHFDVSIMNVSHPNLIWCYFFPGRGKKTVDDSSAFDKMWICSKCVSITQSSFCLSIQQYNKDSYANACVCCGVVLVLGVCSSACSFIH